MSEYDQFKAMLEKLPNRVDDDYGYYADERYVEVFTYWKTEYGEEEDSLLFTFKDGKLIEVE